MKNIKKENSLVGRKVKSISDDAMNIYGQTGTIVSEYSNGVLVEWDGYNNYGDEFKTVLIFKLHTDKEEFENNDPSVIKYELL